MGGGGKKRILIFEDKQNKSFGRRCNKRKHFQDEKKVYEVGVKRKSRYKTDETKKKKKKTLPKIMKLYNEKKGSLLNTINFSHQRRISSDTFASCKHLRSST